MKVSVKKLRNIWRALKDKPEYYRAETAHICVSSNKPNRTISNLKPDYYIVSETYKGPVLSINKRFIYILDW